MVALDITNLSCIYALLDELLADSNMERIKPIDDIRKSIRFNLTCGGVVLVDNTLSPKCFAWINFTQCVFTSHIMADVIGMFVTKKERCKGIGSDLINAITCMAKSRCADIVVFTFRENTLDGGSRLLSKFNFKKDDECWIKEVSHGEQ